MKILGIGYCCISKNSPTHLKLFYHLYITGRQKKINKKTVLLISSFVMQVGFTQYILSHEYNVETV